MGVKGRAVEYNLAESSFDTPSPRFCRVSFFLLIIFLFINFLISREYLLIYDIWSFTVGFVL